MANNGVIMEAMADPCALIKGLSMEAYDTDAWDTGRHKGRLW